MMFLLKILISGVVIAIVSEVSKKLPDVGALIISLPIVTLIAMIFMWYENVDNTTLSEFSFSTAIFVAVTLPMFLLLPFLLDKFNFWISLGIGSLVTILLYTLVAKFI